MLTASPLVPLPTLENTAVIAAYDFGPDGTTFDPSITLTISYDPAVLPEGVAEADLHIAMFDGTDWVALASTVDTAANTISASVGHFTRFAALGAMPPPTPTPQPPPAPRAEELQLATKDGIGTYLTDSAGMTLYYFTSDLPGMSNCSGQCLDFWPPFHADQLEAPAGLSAADFSTATLDNGDPIATYKGWPLYYYVNDVVPGDTNGEGSRGVWYVITDPFYSVLTMTKDELGNYLADAESMTLYRFANDFMDQSNWSGAAWPTFYTGDIEVTSNLDPADFGSITRDDGDRQTTYKGWPLYHFANDAVPGDTNGEGAGGNWFTLADGTEAAPAPPPPAPDEPEEPAPADVVPEVDEPEPAAEPSDTNWWLIWGPIAAVVVIALAAVLWRRGRAAQHSER
jgi:predicted lipoprotein with Yx(FWY)xxD motif